MLQVPFTACSCCTVFGSVVFGCTVFGSIVFGCTAFGCIVFGSGPMSDTTPEWRLFVRGRLRLVRGTDGVSLRPKERAVVAALAFVHPHPLDADGVAQLVWDVDVPATARKSIHNHVVRLRRAAPGLVVTDDGRYHLCRERDHRSGDARRRRCRSLRRPALVSGSERATTDPALVDRRGRGGPARDDGRVRCDSGGDRRTHPGAPGRAIPGAAMAAARLGERRRVARDEKR